MNNDYYIGLGRRKTSTARIFMKKGKGDININEQKGDKYFASEPLYREIILKPLKILNKENDYDLKINVRGGGFTGQMEAIRLGVARAVLQVSLEYRTTLKGFSLLTRDARRKERKHYGLLA